MPLRFSIFEPFPELIYGISEKQDGSMKLLNSKTEFDSANATNRKTYFSKFGISSGRLVLAWLVHGNNIQLVEDRDAAKIFRKTDGLITTTPNLILTITASDCFPIYFYFPSAGLISLVHAGWKGIVNGIIKEALQKISNITRNKINKLLVGIGPGIQQCHFEVTKNELKYFKKWPQAIIKQKNKIFVDLSEIISRQLQDFGIPANHIEKNIECTFCLKNKYFSYRRGEPESLKAMIAYIGIKS